MTLPKISIAWVGCTNVTDDRQTDTQTDGRTTYGTMGSRFRQRTRSAAVVSFSLQLTPLACKSSLNVDRQVFFGRPLFLLPSADVQLIARWAGRSGAIRMTWPASRNLLSPTMSCSRLCPVRASTSAFDTMSFHVTPMIFLKFRW